MRTRAPGASDATSGPESVTLAADSWPQTRGVCPPVANAPTSVPQTPHKVQASATSVPVIDTTGR